MNGTELYFDWAATAIPDKEIWEEALEVALTHWGNPSSLHNAGTSARKALENARKRAALVLGVPKESVFFTSGGTESDHIPLLSLLSRPAKGSIVVSAIEHPAMREMAKMLSLCGLNLISVNPNKDGFVTAEHILSAVQDDTLFVSVMAVNNETGAIQPIYAIADALKERFFQKRKPFFHVDCVQAAGKIPLKLSYPGIDSAALSAHKISGPRGIGILYLAKEIQPFLKGGGQEKNVRSGTENLFGAFAMARCLEKYYIQDKNKESLARFKDQEDWTKAFVKDLSALPACSIIPQSRTESGAFSPWVVQASFRGIPGQVMQRALNQKGICISTGSACSSGKHSHHALDAMNLDAKQKEGAVRFSFGHGTTKEAMHSLVEAIKSVLADFL